MGYSRPNSFDDFVVILSLFNSVICTLFESLIINDLFIFVCFVLRNRKSLLTSVTIQESLLHSVTIQGPINKYKLGTLINRKVNVRTLFLCTLVIILSVLR